MEASTNAESVTQTKPSAPAAAGTTKPEEREEQQEEDENELLMAKAQPLIDKITAGPENPSPEALHALSTILETQESRYMEDADHSSTNNARSSHSIGRLGNLIGIRTCVVITRRKTRLKGENYDNLRQITYYVVSHFYLLWSGSCLISWWDESGDSVFHVLSQL